MILAAVLATVPYWFTWFPGSLLALVGLLAFAYKGLRTFVRMNDALPRLLSAADQLQPNGGSSVKDDITHIKREQTRVARELATTNQMARMLTKDRDVFDLRLLRIEARLQIPPEAKA